MTSYRDWVVETSNTTGTGPYSLSGSPPAGTSYFTFRQRYSNGDDQIVYWVVSADRTKWEKNRLGTLTYGTPDTLSRDVIESTNGDAPVSWVGGDLPLRVYVVPDAEAMELAITGGAGPSRSPLLRDGAIWTDTTNPWASDRVPFKLNPEGNGEIEVGAWEGSISGGIYMPSKAQAVLAAGAGNHTVVAADAGWMITLDNSGAARTLSLPALSSVPAGFPVIVYGLSSNFAINVTPNGTDALDGGANGVTTPFPGRRRIMIWKDTTTSKWRTDFDYSAFHTMAVTVVSSPVASVSFTALPYWANYIEFDWQMAPATNNVVAYMRTCNSSFTFYTGGTDYAYNVFYYNDTGGIVGAGAGSAAQMLLADFGLPNSGTFATRGKVFFSNIQDSVNRPSMYSEAWGSNGANFYGSFQMGQQNVAVGPLYGAQFFFNSGNIATARIELKARS